MENFVYKNHDFKTLNNFPMILECIKCKYSFEIYKPGSVFIFSFNEDKYISYENILSCNEVIIKSIIE